MLPFDKITYHALESEATFLPPLEAWEGHLHRFSAGQILLCHLAFKDFEGRGEITEGLSSWELERAAKFKFHEHRVRYSVGRWALRQVLGELLGKAPHSLIINPDTNGKPQLAVECGQCHFNIAHTDQTLVMAFCRERTLGVDVENRMRLEGDVLEKLFRFVSHSQEQEHWKTLPQSKQADFFAQLWCMKEALLKAHGTGLRIEPRTLNLCEAIIAQRGSHNLESLQYQVYGGLLDTEHAYGLAVSRVVQN